MSGLPRFSRQIERAGDASAAGLVAPLYEARLQLATFRELSGA
jgi:hypothetical protein